MMYSSIREALLNATSRMPFGAYMLPTVSFLDETYPKDDGRVEIEK